MTAKPPLFSSRWFEERSLRELDQWARDNPDWDKEPSLEDLLVSLHKKVNRLQTYLTWMAIGIAMLVGAYLREWL